MEFFTFKVVLCNKEGVTIPPYTLEKNTFNSVCGLLSCVKMWDIWSDNGIRTYSVSLVDGADLEARLIVKTSSPRGLVIELIESCRIQGMTALGSPKNPVYIQRFESLDEKSEPQVIYHMDSFPVLHNILEPKLMRIALHITNTNGQMFKRQGTWDVDHIRSKGDRFETANEWAGNVLSSLVKLIGDFEVSMMSLHVLE